MKANKTYLFGLTLVWLYVIILINPIGDFPLNDDWSYAYNVKKLALENEIDFHDWGAMTLIVHTIWGALFCKIFGFSFTILRISTLVLGWGTMISSFLFFQEAGIKRSYAFGGTLLFVFNVFFLANAFSYMTEVPFLFYFITGALFFLKAINNKRHINIILATIFSILATLTRQIGLILPIAFLFVFIIKNKVALRSILAALLPSVFTFLSLSLFTNWRKTHFGLSANFANTSDILQNFQNGQFLFALENKSYEYFTLWGLFLIPLLIFLFPYFKKKIPLLEKIISTVITLLIFYPFIVIPNKDFMGNTLVNLGVGPIVLPTSSQLSPTQIGDNDWENLYNISFIAGMLLFQWILIKAYKVYRIVRNNSEKGVNWSTLFGLTTAFGYFLFLMLNNHYFDRYNIIAIPFLILALIPTNTDFQFSKKIKVISLLSIALIMIYSIGVTHDYLSWNRARWEVTNFATNNLDIPKDHLNGGFEYKGMYDIPYFVPTTWEDIEEWNTAKEQYKIAFSPQCKYDVINTASYSRYFPPRVDSMFLLKKQFLSQIDTIYCEVEKVTPDGKYLLTNKNAVLIQNSLRVNDKSYRGEYSLLLNKENPYGFTFKLKDVKPCEKILVSVWANPIQHASTATLVSGYFNYIPGLHMLRVNAGNGWGRSSIEFKVPANFHEKELTFHLHNGSEEGIWFDDLMIVRMN